MTVIPVKLERWVVWGPKFYVFSEVALGQKSVLHAGLVLLDSISWFLSWRPTWLLYSLRGPYLPGNLRFLYTFKYSLLSFITATYINITDFYRTPALLLFLYRSIFPNWYENKQIKFMHIAFTYLVCLLISEYRTPFQYEKVYKVQTNAWATDLVPMYRSKKAQIAHKSSWIRMSLK